MLGEILDATVAVYRLACRELADRLSVGEEHFPIAASDRRSAPELNGPRSTHARARRDYRDARPFVTKPCVL